MVRICYVFYGGRWSPSGSVPGRLQQTGYLAFHHHGWWGLMGCMGWWFHPWSMIHHDSSWFQSWISMDFLILRRIMGSSGRAFASWPADFLASTNCLHDSPTVFLTSHFTVLPKTGASAYWSFISPTNPWHIWITKNRMICPLLDNFDEFWNNLGGA